MEIINLFTGAAHPTRGNRNFITQFRLVPIKKGWPAIKLNILSVFKYITEYAAHLRQLNCGIDREFSRM
uniref:Uncharacterized protein n=1 Tax=viral metagenome TaxID=1070528 RepID=A0A6M3JLT2_9ZZZZ